ncbi:MAG: hypothetical protein ACTSX4_07065 [Candidatus Helarchaeota archaeon]
MSYKQDYLSFSAPELFKKINKLKLQKDSQKMLDIFTESQNIIINDNEYINKQSLFNFLSLLSRSFSLKKGHKEVNASEVKTALILYYHLTHSHNLGGLIKGDASSLYKYSEEDCNIKKDVIVSTPALNRLETFMQRLKNYMPKKSATFREQIKSAILILASILGDRDVITRKNIDDSYNLLRILIFRTPLNEYEVLGDFFQLLNTDAYKKMNAVKIPHVSLNKIKHTIHFLQGRKLSNENIFPNPELKKIGISKFPIESVIYNLSQIYGLRFANREITPSDMEIILNSFEKILLKFDFSYPNSFTSFPLCNLEELYKHAFNFKISSGAKELLMRIRRSLSAAISKLVGRNEYVFNFSAEIPRIISSIYTLGSLYTYRMNHRKIDVHEIKQGIRAYYFLLNRFDFQ